jgi:hypothetical protein
MSESLSTSQNNTNNSEKSLENVIVSSENNTNKDPTLTTISEKLTSSNKEDPAATAAGLPAGWVSLSGKDGAKTLANLFSKAALNK